MKSAVLIMVVCLSSVVIFTGAHARDELDPASRPSLRHAPSNVRPPLTKEESFSAQSPSSSPKEERSMGKDTTKDLPKNMHRAAPSRSSKFLMTLIAAMQLKKPPVATAQPSAQSTAQSTTQQPAQSAVHSSAQPTTPPSEKRSPR